MTARLLTIDFYINNGVALTGDLSIDQAHEQMMSAGPRSDPRWEYTDDNGHYHAHSDDDDRYPTLVARNEHVECDGSCNGVCQGEGFDTTRYFCRGCQVEIKPGLIPGPYRFSIPGPKSWDAWVDGPIETLDEDLSVRIDVEGETYFGFARCVERESQSYGDGVTSHRSHLVGTGALGRRKA